MLSENEDDHAARLQAENHRLASQVERLTAQLRDVRDRMAAVAALLEQLPEQLAARIVAELSPLVYLKEARDRRRSPKDLDRDMVVWRARQLGRTWAQLQREFKFKSRSGPRAACRRAQAALAALEKSLKRSVS